MRRRTFLSAAGAGLVAFLGAGTAIWSQVPVIPKRPEPDADTSRDWVRFHEGKFILKLPRIEMGQNIATALKQIACAELQVGWDDVTVEFHDTRMERVKSTVGSESVSHYAEPLAQACSALRNAIREGRNDGLVPVVNRPIEELLSFRKGALVGTEPEIVQGQDIVRGNGLFAADVRLPGMLFGRILRAPVSLEVPSSPRSWDEKGAAALSGFAGLLPDCDAMLGRSRGIGILATRPGILDKIETALNVEWSTGEQPIDAETTLPLDIDKELAAGPLPHMAVKGSHAPVDCEVDVRLDLPFAAHAAMEPRAAVCEWRDDRLFVWTGTQDAFYVRDFLADAHGLETDRVLVKPCRVGGGFGSRTLCTVEAEAAALALHAGRPVKVQWTRAQEFTQGFHRPPSSHRVRGKISDGTISHWDHNQVSSHIIFTSAGFPAWMQGTMDLVTGDPGVARGMKVPYRINEVRAAYKSVRQPVHSGPWRGLGAGPNCLAVESAIDEAALVAGENPIAFRMRHIGATRLAAVLERVADISGFPGAAPEAAAGERTGRGIACGIYKEKSYAAVVADVSVTAENGLSVTRLWCVHDCGLVINPGQVRAQCEGNLVWSIGMVLFDGLQTAKGRVTSIDFIDAPVPAIADVPPISTELIESDSRPSGAGETVMVAGPGAIANAIRAATGVRPFRFPVRLEDLLR